MAAEGFGVIADTSAMSKLARNLGKAAPAERKHVSAAMRKLALAVLADGKKNASWSKRISGSGSAHVHGLNAVVDMGGGDAFFAVPVENRGAGDVVHPVFGNLNGQSSTNKNSHPAFLLPALEKHEGDIIDVLTAAIQADALAILDGL